MYPDMDPRDLSASITNLASLLMRISTYLLIRLPAEITLPHRDYPLPTIFKVDDSYQSREVLFPGSTPSVSGHNSPSASRTMNQRPLPSPRLLWTDKRLPLLLKEDPAAFARFVDGACLLAWDVAWLCRSQNSNMVLDSWEDVCAMGRNLHQLLVADSRKKPSRRESIDTNTQRPSKGTNTSDLPIATLGSLSHGTSHSFLGSVAGAQYMREWRLKSPNELYMKVRAALFNEMQGAEWEMIDEQDEFAEEAPEIIGTKVLVTDGAGSRKTSDSTGTIKSKVRDDLSSNQGRIRGVNGWTKVKSRNGEIAR